MIFSMVFFFIILCCFNRNCSKEYGVIGLKSNIWIQNLKKYHVRTFLFSYISLGPFGSWFLYRESFWNISWNHRWFLKAIYFSETKGNSIWIKRFYKGKFVLACLRCWIFCCENWSNFRWKLFWKPNEIHYEEHGIISP